MFQIKEGMVWPPMDYLSWKAAEHSAWYTGDPEVLANFYTQYLSQNFLSLPYNLKNDQQFWGRQVRNQGDIYVHVPIAGDIAETSANFLFSESPAVKIAEAHTENAGSTMKQAQDELDDMLIESGFFRKILEAAETGAAIGGVFIKLAWDADLSPYPIPVIVQADRAIPEFKFGMLTAVTFWKVVEASTDGNKVYRLLERYEKGAIKYTLYLGTSDRLGKAVNLAACEETKDLPEAQETVDALLAVYVPNMLPNRLDRNSYLGRSDYSGIEGLMDSLDETFSSWLTDIALARAKILLPESYLCKDKDGSFKYNIDQSLYVRLDVDPTSMEGNRITIQQFDIRADKFEKTSLNLMERIITSAGYSPQSFGLNIQGRAESGTALSLRERKSFATKNKKQNYWQPALKRIVELMQLVYVYELSGTMDINGTINIAFSDGITNDFSETSNAVKLISDALAASTETKVRLLHPDWEEEQILAEVDKIIEENNIGQMPNPDDNLDLDQLKQNSGGVDE
jgi:A118 family predicted phage portal protein